MLLRYNVRRSNYPLGNPNYLFIIFVAALPILALQWLVGFDIFVQRWKVWLLGIIIPSLYMTAIKIIPLDARRVAVPGMLLPVINVPVADLVFFLAVNTLLVQGMMLAMYFPLVVQRIRRYAQLLRRGLFKNEPPGRG
jgi:hypothetical protein